MNPTPTLTQIEPSQREKQRKLDCLDLRDQDHTTRAQVLATILARIVEISSTTTMAYGAQNANGGKLRASTIGSRVWSVTMPYADTVKNDIDAASVLI